MTPEPVIQPSVATAAASTTVPRKLMLACALALAAACSLTEARAQGAGDLLVAPTRVVLEGRQRAAELMLLNRGAKTATYRISFVQIRMDENGATREIESPGPGELFADTLIRYSPRQVVLEPNISQTVRLQLRKPADLPSGEYRSHLLFRAVPAVDSSGKVAEAPGEQATGLSIKLIPVYGVSIPVIVRHGETAATVSLSDLEVVPPSGADPAPALRFRMTRSGNRSVYGDFTVTFVPVKGKPVVVGQVQGVAVYTPNPQRVASILLRPPPGTILRAGVLRLSYAKHDKSDETLAEAELRIP